MQPDPDPANRTASPKGTMQTSPRYSCAFSRLALLLLALVLLFGPAFRGQAAALVPQFTTIQDAIDAAGEGDIVEIPAGTYTESLTVTKPLTLAGASAETTIIRAVTDQRVITVSDGIDLTLRNLSLTGGSPLTGENGGAVLIQNGSLIIEACLLHDNQAEYGGAVYQAGTGSVTITGSSIHHNQASKNGGGIFAAGDVTLTSVNLDNNTAALPASDGGGVYVEAGDLAITGGQMVNNQAGHSGGGAFVFNNLTIQGVTFSGNTAGHDGGAILQWNGAGLAVTVDNAHFAANQAVRYGGALSVAHGAQTTIHDSRFIGNAVVGDTILAVNTAGGGVHYSGVTSGHTLSIAGSTFTGNTADCQGECTSLENAAAGGGLYAQVGSTEFVSLIGNQFEGNTAWTGGGVYANRVDIQSSTFHNNQAQEGGGVFVWGSLLASKSVFTGNEAAGHGGAIYTHPSTSTVTVLESRFTGSASTSSGGGALYLQASTSAHLENVVVMGTLVQSGSSVAFVQVPSVTLLHSTLTGTTTPTGRGDGISIDQAINPESTVRVINTIIANQNTGVVVESCSDCSLDHSLWYGNTQDTAGSGTISNLNPFTGDPAFDLDGYHLTSASAAIDRGTAGLVLFDIDQEGRGDQPDIGADEFIAPVIDAHIFLPLIRR